MVRIPVVLFSVLVLTAITMASVQNKGAAEIDLYGGKSGNVPFPHLRHQNVLEDCNICHTLFPQEAGAIQKLKNAGELKKKQVMNKQCTKCHRQLRKKGEKTGPITCKTCHVKVEKERDK